MYVQGGWYSGRTFEAPPPPLESCSKGGLAESKILKHELASSGDHFSTLPPPPPPLTSLTKAEDQWLDHWDDQEWRDGGVRIWKGACVNWDSELFVCCPYQWHFHRECESGSLYRGSRVSVRFNDKNIRQTLSRRLDNSLILGMAKKNYW